MCRKRPGLTLPGLGDALMNKLFLFLTLITLISCNVQTKLKMTDHKFKLEKLSIGFRKMISLKYLLLSLKRYLLEAILRVFWEVMENMICI